MSSRRWSNVTKIIVASCLVVLMIILLITFRVLIAPTVVAFLLAFILSYPVNWIQRSTGWARSLSVTVVYIVLLAILALTPIVVAPRLGAMVSSLQETLQDLVDDLQNISAGPFLRLGSSDFSLDMLLQQTGDILANLLFDATGNPLSIARGVTNSVITIVYVLVLNFWILKDIYKIQRAVIEQIPVDYQEDARRIGQELGRIWHAFLRGQLALAFSVGLLTWILLVIVGMPNAGGLALLAGVMEFLPSIGPGISGTIGTVFAFFQGSTWLPVNQLTFAIIVGIIYSIIAQIENIYLIPRLIGRQVQLHPAVTFVGIIAGTLVFGLLGVLLATPIMASARVILSYIHRKLLDLEPFEPIKTPQASVRIPGLIAGRKIEGIIFDLDGTLAQVDWTIPIWAANHLTWLDPVVEPEQRCFLARRLMVKTEGVANFLISQLHHFGAQRALERMEPWFNRWRGYPPAAKLVPQPGIAEMIESLNSQYRLAILSTRHSDEINCFLRNAGLSEESVDVIVGHEETHNILPHSEPLLYVAGKFMLAPSQLLMVSDTDSNLRSARAVEMATVGVLCGLGDEGDFLESDLVLAAPPELVDWL